MSQAISLTVTGMKCGGCESAVKTALQNIDGVICVQASFKENKVDVEYDPAKVDDEWEVPMPIIRSVVGHSL